LKNIFISFIFIFFAKYTCALNIDESIKSTIKNNSKVKIALEKVNESKEIIIFATGSKLPTITSTISGTYSTADTITTTESTTPETFTDSYKITMKKNIYDFGLNNLEIERSKIIFNNELILFKSTIQDLILDAINGYLTVINYEKSLEANKKNYDAVSQALEETKTRFDLGSATLYDLQNAEASFASASTYLFIAEQNLLISKKSFKNIVGLDPINLEDILEINSYLNAEDFINNSMQNNLDLLLITNDIKNNEILILKEKKSKKPSLDFTGTGLYSNAGRLENGTENTSGSLALTLTIPLFQQGQDDSNIRKYQSKILQSQMKLQDEKANLEILISHTYKDYKISESQMSSNTIIIKSIKTSLNSLKEEYNIGTKTISDLVEEEEKLLNANVNYLNSKKNYLNNYFKLKSLDASLINLFQDYLPEFN
tara:strand:- start:62 stop:1348 length:1287 start_codon:yes stop_codon:yes gene_type:complete